MGNATEVKCSLSEKKKGRRERLVDHRKVRKLVVGVVSDVVDCLLLFLLFVTK